jgi:hypothetical protein
LKVAFARAAATSSAAFLGAPRDVTRTRVPNDPRLRNALHTMAADDITSLALQIS